MSENINVKKRNGRGIEPLDIDKVHEMVGHACEGLSGGEGDGSFLLAHPDERTHEDVLAGLQLQGVLSVKVGGHGHDAVGQVGANDGFLG